MTPAHPSDNAWSACRTKCAAKPQKQTERCDTDPSHPPGLKIPQIQIWLGYMRRADPWIPSGSAIWLHVTNLWVFHDCLLLHTPNMSFIGKFPLACCCDDICSIFLQSDDFLNQNPKLDSCLLTETMTQWLDVGLIQCWIRWTMKSSQTMLEEFCSWWFSKVLVTTDGGFFAQLTVGLRVRGTALWSKGKNVKASFEVPEPNTQVIKPSIIIIWVFSCPTETRRRCRSFPSRGRLMDPCQQRGRGGPSGSTSTASQTLWLNRCCHFNQPHCNWNHLFCEQIY